ncbi:hypothetical protein ACFL56_01495 [Candidatus Margulisiibacteriota bacterium]
MENSITRKTLKKKIIRFIEDKKSATFDDLRFAIFNYQVKHNKPFRYYLVHILFQKPLYVSTELFKDFPITCARKRNRYFESSGTTRKNRSRVYQEDFDVYTASLLKNFKDYMLPDSISLPFLILFPALSEIKHSSLAFMFDAVSKEFSLSQPQYFVRNNKYYFNDLYKTLKKYQQKRQPIMLLTTSLSLAFFMEYLHEKNYKLKLSYLSRIMDTGGYKGISLSIAQKDLHGLVYKQLGISRDFIVNEYGMCEMNSQFYDGRLRKKLKHSSQGISLFKNIPHWVHTEVINPQGIPLGTDQKGTLVHYDLANLDTVYSIRTNDIGIKKNNGFKIVGRHTAEAPKGCSLISEVIKR